MKIFIKQRKLDYDVLNECSPGTFFQLASSSTLEKDVDNNKIYMIAEARDTGFANCSYCSVSGEGELVTRVGPMIGHVLECDVVPYDQEIPISGDVKSLEEFEIGSCVRLFLGNELGELLLIVKVQTDRNIVTAVEFETGKVFRYSKEILAVEHDARLIIKGQK